MLPTVLILETRSLRVHSFIKALPKHNILISVQLIILQMKFKLSVYMMLIHDILVLQLQIETNFEVNDPHRF